MSFSFLNIIPSPSTSPTSTDKTQPSLSYNPLSPSNVKNSSLVRRRDLSNNPVDSDTDSESESHTTPISSRTRINDISRSIAKSIPILSSPNPNLILNRRRASTSSIRTRSSSPSPSSTPSRSKDRSRTLPMADECVFDIHAIFHSPARLKLSNTILSNNCCPPTPTVSPVKINSIHDQQQHPPQLQEFKFYRNFRLHAPNSPYIIGADNPIKVLWDVALFLISLFNLLQTHQNIKHQHHSPFHFLEVFFVIDILLNFITEHKDANTGTLTRNPKLVAWKYLTSWFIFDAVSLIPFETLLIQPILDMQSRRKWFNKALGRTKGFLKVLPRVLRGRNFRMFGMLKNQTKHIGMGGKKLLGALIRYIPKYVLFVKKMRYVMLIRSARAYHVVRKIFKDLYVESTQVASIRAQALSEAVWRALVVLDRTPSRSRSRSRSERKNENENEYEEDDSSEEDSVAEEERDSFDVDATATYRAPSPPILLQRRHSTSQI